MVRRTLAIAAILITALLLQSTVFAEVRLLGARPELMYLVVIVLAILEGPSEGAVVGFVGGMMQDFLLNQPKGITALTLTLLGYTVGLARQYIVSPSPLLPTMMVLAGTDNMRDVIAFPKTASAADLMIDAPGEVDQKQLEELHLRVVDK